MQFRSLDAGGHRTGRRLRDKKSVDWQFPAAVLALVSGSVFAVLANLAADSWWTIGAATYLGCAMLCMVAQADAASRRWLLGLLKDPDFVHAYKAASWGLMRRIRHNYAPKMAVRKPLTHNLKCAMTWQLYDVAKLVALVYPVALALLFGTLAGHDIVLGDQVLLKAPSTALEPVLAGTMLVLFLAMCAMRPIRPVVRPVPDDPPHAAGAEQTSPASQTYFPLAMFLYVLAASLLVAMGGPTLLIVAAIGGGVFLALRFLNSRAAVTTAVSMTGTVAFAFLVASASSVLWGGAVVGVAVLLCWIGAYLDRLGHSIAARVLLTVAFPVAWILIMLFIPWPEIGGEELAVFLFLGVFPLINAIFDTLSYATTLSFIHRGLRAGSVPALPFLLGLLDLVIATFLFVLLGATLVALLEGLNQLSGGAVLDMGAVFSVIEQGGASNFWLMGMLFSTILPTFAHACLAIAGLQNLLPRPVRLQVAELVQDTPNAQWKAVLAPFLAAAAFALPIIGVLILGLEFAGYFWPSLETWLEWYIRLLREISAQMGI